MCCTLPQLHSALQVEGAGGEVAAVCPCPVSSPSEVCGGHSHYRNFQILPPPCLPLPPFLPPSFPPSPSLLPYRLQRCVKEVAKVCDRCSPKSFLDKAQLQLLDRSLGEMGRLLSGKVSDTFSLSCPPAPTLHLLPSPNSSLFLSGKC